MKPLVCFSSILPMLFFAGLSYAHFTGKGHMHTLSETQQHFLNSDCRSTDSCDLKRFTLTKLVYEVWFSDAPNHPTYGNGVIMEYETDSVDAIENYAIVQFKKGCVFHSAKNRAGRVHRNVSDTVPSFGRNVPFCFPSWVIDSHDTDPAYNSDPEHGRFYLLRWNRPGSYDDRTEKFYGAEKPTIPVVYMTDYPAGAFVTGTGARNVALQFNTCIYRASDVPADTRRDDINFGKPISCLGWQNVYVYDFARGGFQTQWTDVPQFKEPSMLGDLLLVIFVALFMALALVMFARFNKLRPEDRF